MAKSVPVENSSKDDEIPAGSFVSLFQQALKERGLNVNQFARMLGYKSSGHLTLVLTGRRPVPIDKLESWLNTLRPRPALYVALYLRALEEFAPPLLWQILKQIDGLLIVYAQQVESILRRAKLEAPSDPPSLLRLLYLKAPGRGGNTKR